MRILAIDIGAGTQDVLLYDNGVNIENCIKMVLPSPSSVFAAMVRETTRLCQDLFVKGNIIGGGAFASALKKHVEGGSRVVMTENAAYTVRNNLEEVKELGIEIMREPPKSFSGKTLITEEVNLMRLKSFLADFKVALTDLDAVAIAVQDHGASLKGISNRRFRIHKMRDRLEDDPRPQKLAFKENEIPPYFLRMKSAAQVSKRQLPNTCVVVMDTSPAAILGCIKDSEVEVADPILAVNIGNSHTMAAIIEEEKIIGMLEHHTRLLSPQKIEKLLVNFAAGNLSDENVFEDNGHGLFFLKEPPGLSKIEKIVVTGPNRHIISRTNLNVYFAAPAGDVMMTGPIGLIEATKRKIQ